MGILDDTRFIERLQFFNGQRLFASDLQEIEAFNREMRWLHNRSLHQPGIGNGFAVAGKRGDREVTIGAGYALDAAGREIVLTDTLIAPVPPVAGDDDGQPVFYELTVAYPEDDQLEEAETRAGVCLPRGVVRLREAPVFCWVRLEKDELNNNTLRAKDPRLAADIKDGRKIVLARAEVFNCQLNRDLLIAQRRSARPARQPYIACGSVDPTDWEAWFITGPEEAPEPAEPTEGPVLALAINNRQPPTILPIGLTARIDTSSAGFLTTPCYSARIAGSRIITREIDNDGQITTLSILVDGLISIEQAGPKGFTVFVLLLAQLPNFSVEIADPQRILFMSRISAAAADQPSESEIDEFLDLFRDWHIVWMGVEG